MPRKPESLFRDKVVRWLKQKKGVQVFSIQQKAIRGVPDLLICLKGRFVGMELKSSEKAPVTELQNFFLDRISECGGIALVVSPENWAEIQKAVEGLLYEGFL